VKFEDVHNKRRCLFDIIRHTVLCLPDEILLIIISHLKNHWNIRDTKSLISLSLTNRAMCSIVQPILFERINLVLDIGGTVKKPFLVSSKYFMTILSENFKLGGYAPVAAAKIGYQYTVRQKGLLWLLQPLKCLSHLDLSSSEYTISCYSSIGTDIPRYLPEDCLMDNLVNFFVEAENMIRSLLS
jgi:hypothetical protein